MNTPIEPNAEPISQPIDEKRRRLAKGGIAAPIVLGTLLSRPVLGAAPHNCTISGQMSGNVSTHGAAVPCGKLGYSPDYWRINRGWPSPYIYGAPAAGQCPVDSSSAGIATVGTRFSRATAVGSVFLDVFRCVAISETKTSTVQTGSEIVGPADPRFASGVPATLLQVLQTGGSLNETAIAALGRAAIASLLNAATFAPDYPLTGKQVIDMFNAVCKGGTYPVNGSVSWTADQVKTYYESLYGQK